MTASLNLTNVISPANTIDFCERRSSLYWGKYRYRARVRFIGFKYIGSSSTVEEWETYITMRFDGNPSMVQHLTDHSGLIKNFISLKDKCKTLRGTPNEFSIRREGGTVAFFSNNISFLDDIKHWQNNMMIDFTEAQVGQSSNVKFFAREPKSKFRVYLKVTKVATGFTDEFRDFLARNKALKPSRSLIDWVNLTSANRSYWKRHWCNSSYFIDYDDASMSSYLALCYPNLMGKKFKLEKHT